MNLLTPAEEQLMLLFWKLENFYMKDAMEQLPEPRPHQNTVSTYLKILLEKGFLSAEKEGRIFKYSVNITLDDYKKLVLKDVISKYFRGSENDILKFLFEENLVSQSSLADYIDIRISAKPLPRKENFMIADAVLSAVKPKKKKKKKSK